MQITKRSWFFAKSTDPKAKTAEVEITHSIKNTEIKLHNLWDYLERKRKKKRRKQRILTPHKIWRGFSVAVYISCYEKTETKRFALYLSYVQLNAHTLTKYTPYENEVALFFKNLKTKRHQYPFIYVSEISYDHQ